MTSFCLSTSSTSAPTLAIVFSIRATEARASPLALAPASIRVITTSASPPSASMVWAISSVALRVSLARLLTSAATTAKVRPASPARMASMVALRARMLVVSAILSISCAERRTCSIAAEKLVTCWPRASTNAINPAIWPSEDWINAVPSDRRSIARSDSRRASSLASATLVWSASSARTVSRSALCSDLSDLDEAITASTTPATSVHPTVTAPQLSGIIPSALAWAVSMAICCIAARPFLVRRNANQGW